MRTTTILCAAIGLVLVGLLIGACPKGPFPNAISGTCCLPVAGCVEGYPTSGACEQIGGTWYGPFLTCHDLTDCPECRRSDPCPADINRDGEVGILDFLLVLDSWGPCQ